jgi:hypothetical protein
MPLEGLEQSYGLARLEPVHAVFRIAGPSKSLLIGALTGQSATTITPK